MWKRYAVSVLVVLICIPLFSLSVSAETLRMTDVVPDTKLPRGYVSTYVKLNRSSFNQGEVWFYWLEQDVYLNFVFEGTCTFLSTAGRFVPAFSDPDSLQVRLYYCDGNDLFIMTPQSRLQVYVPLDTVLSVIPDLWSYLDMEYVIDYDVSDFYIAGDYLSSDLSETQAHGWITLEGWSDSDSTATVTARIPSYSVNLSAMSNISITQEQFFQKTFDYYYVRRYGSSMYTSMDYPGLTWNLMSNGRLYFPGSEFPYPSGYPVAVACSDSSTQSYEGTNIKYETGAYYYVRPYNNQFYLYESDLLTTVSPSLTVFNRYLNHFGLASIYYSNPNSQLSDDISGLGDQMSGWTDQMDGFQDQANSAVNDISSSIASFGSVFSSIWGSLPDLYFALLAIVLVLVVARKVVGR